MKYEHWFHELAELVNPGLLIFMLIAASVVGYFAYDAILTLPKPETFAELVKYLFHQTSDYFKTLFLALMSGLLVLASGITMIILGGKYLQNYKVISIAIALLGAIMAVGSFYFFGYFIWLLVIVLVLGVILIWFINESNTTR